MSLKRILYRLWMRTLRYWWMVTSGRRVRAMEENFRFTSDTEFPTHRRLRLPRGGPKSELSRYGDFVQMHACCQFLNSLTHPPTVVDVGAHHGAYAVVLGRLATQQGGKVIAIEPNPQSFRTLAKNVEMNGLAGRVALEPVAITEACSTVRLTLKGSQSFVTESPVARTVEVNGEPLADVLARHDVSRVELLLIDVEGAELPVLRSFPWATLEIDRIFCELHPYAWPTFGYGPEDVCAFLRQRGLRCLDMYFQEYDSFPERRYIGPCCLVPDRAPGRGAPCLDT